MTQSNLNKWRGATPSPEEVQHPLLRQPRFLKNAEQICLHGNHTLKCSRCALWQVTVVGLVRQVVAFPLAGNSIPNSPLSPPLPCAGGGIRGLVGAVGWWLRPLPHLATIIVVAIVIGVTIIVAIAIVATVVKTLYDIFVLRSRYEESRL